MRMDKVLNGVTGGNDLGGRGTVKQLAGHVGFDSLPDQLVNKSLQNGFCFNIMCIGETGIGKNMFK